MLCARPDGIQNDIQNGTQSGIQVSKTNINTTAVTDPGKLHARVAGELGVSAAQVARTLALFDEGATLPFIARYRKEVTGGLDEIQLRDIRERAQYLTELGERREAILRSIEEQGKLNDELRNAIANADTKQALEDLYLPFKPKRRTRAAIARERGLEPLADSIRDHRNSDAGVARMAADYVSDEVPDADAALQGARDIIAEEISERADVRGWIRDVSRARGTVRSTVIPGKEREDSRFRDYFDYSGPVVDIPGHRMLAIRRGEAEGELSWRIETPADELRTWLTREVLRSYGVGNGVGNGVGRGAAAGTAGARNTPTGAVEQLSLAAADALRRIIAPAIEVELRLELKTRADEEAIAIFGRNLEQLLLASPAGERRVIGLDPGFRTGVKVAVIGATGALEHTDTLYLHQEERFKAQLRALIGKYSPEFIAIGNGTASRETESLVSMTVSEAKATQSASTYARVQVVVVNEAGASVYSASDVARAEFPGLDVSLRGAVSIARRLQDPLAELVKIEPKSIGVGQYQHDVNQTRLKGRLDDVVESCVNRVGVEVNTASSALLGYVAGISSGVAQAIVSTRDEKGGFRSRAELLKVPRLGARTYEQAAGFLRVRGGAHPLDASAVHPERYALVEQIASDLGVGVGALIGDDELISAIKLEEYVSSDAGLPTLRDIAAELRKPGRDPRSAFEAPSFRDDISKPEDLKPGMVLDGVVTNIVAFGCFVDVGVHQDGLVHISQLADRFVRDPNEVVTVGKRVKVTVVSVDLPRSRIALTMRKDSGQKIAQKIR